MEKRPFVLSGGGARGFAHVGVLKALEEADIYPSAIAATSAGALVGAFIADGFTPDELKDIVLKNVGFRSLIDWRHFGSSLISLNKIGDFMRKNLRHQRIEDLLIPFFPTATNFLDGSQGIFNKGNLVDAVLAASSIPAMFPPVMIENIPYVDGGLFNNLPIEPFLYQKDTVIAVHVNPIAPYDAKVNTAKLIDRALHLSFVPTIQAAAKGCHLFIEPSDLHAFGMFDAHKLGEIYEVGYKYAKELLK
jgi:NTE family protein